MTALNCLAGGVAALSAAPGAMDSQTPQHMANVGFCLLPRAGFVPIHVNRVDDNRVDGFAGRVGDVDVLPSHENVYPRGDTAGLRKALLLRQYLARFVGALDCINQGGDVPTAAKAVKIACAHVPTAVQSTASGQKTIAIVRFCQGPRTSSW